MAYETDWSENDPSGEITYTAGEATWSVTLLNDSAARLTEDKGASHFSGDFTHDVDDYIQSATQDGIAIFYALAEELDDYANWLYSMQVWGDDSPPKIIIAEYDNGTETELAESANNSVTNGSSYYIEISRTGTTFTFDAWENDATKSGAPDIALSGTLTSNRDYRYLYGASRPANNREGTFSVNLGIDLNEAVAEAARVPQQTLLGAGV